MSNTIYVGNLDYDIQEDFLEDVFNRFGCIFDIKIIRDPETDVSRGFCFITFEEENAAADAIEEMAGQPFPGRERLLRVNTAHDKSTNANSRRSKKPESQIRSPEKPVARRSRHAFQRNYYLRNFSDAPAKAPA